MWEQAKPLCGIWPSSKNSRTVFHRLLRADGFLQELCCPADTACRGSSQTSSHVICCPDAFSCSDNVAAYPTHTFECPSSAGDGCCAIGLRCAFELCLEYHYKTLAVFQPLPNHYSTSFVSQGLYDCIMPASMNSVQTSIPPSSISADRVGRACASQNCRPENVGQKGQNLPISDRILGTPTAWRAKVGEIAVKSQAEENWDSKNGKRRLRRLGCVVMGLLLITVVMFVF